MGQITRIKQMTDPSRPKSGVMDLGDDGFRLYGRFPNSTNAREWTLIMEYKHADFPSMASCVVENLMLGAAPYDESADPLANVVDDEDAPRNEY